MKNWLRRLRGIAGMGLTWGVAGSLVGAGIELLNRVWPNPLGGMMDLWPVALGLPGFLGGIAFSTVLTLTARSRRLDELSTWKFALLGGVGGLIVGVLPLPLHMLGLVPAGFNLWPVTMGLVVPLFLGGATIATGTLALARATEDSPELAAKKPSSRAELPSAAAPVLLEDPD